MKLYELGFKSSVDYAKLKPTDIFGNVFEQIYVKEGKQFRFYVQTGAQEEILRKYFNVKPTDTIPTPKLFLQVKLKNERDFYNRLEYSNILNILPQLNDNEQMRIWIALEPNINELFMKKSDKLKREAQKVIIGKRKREVLANLLESYAKDNLYLLQLRLYSNDKSRLKVLAKQLTQYIHTSSRKLAFVLKKATKDEDKQPKIGWTDFHLRYKTQLWLYEDLLNNALPLPNPQQIPVALSLGVALPYAKLDRKDILIGDDVLYHEPVYLDWADFQRHAIIFGSTGSGKSNTLEVLAQELSKYGVVIFVDPNSQSARKLSQIANYSFSITADKPNFGLNILQLPNIYPDRNKNVDYQISVVLQIFDKILNLVDTAVNVRYILQVLLRQMYAITDNVTFRDVYENVIALQQGTLDLNVNDETFEKEKELLQSMQAQSFMSILSRLKLLVDNSVFRYVTSETTLDWFKLINGTKRGLIVFDVGKSVGTDVSILMQMMIAVSLFNFALIRDMKSLEKIPIFLIIDEAQNIAHFDFINEVLAEARKYALHLVLATQSFVRLQALAGENNARAINANTNVKLLMRLTEGSDIKQLAQSVGADSEIQEALPKLSIGQGFLFILGKPGEYTVPKLVQIKKSELEDKVGQLTQGFEPKAPSGKGLTPETINPALRLIEAPPDALEQRILFTIHNKGEITIPDLVSALGVKRDEAMKRIAKLSESGNINVEPKGKTKVLHYGKGLFRLKGIVDNEEGRKVALKVLMKYMKQGFVVVRGKQSGDIRPDFVALRFDANYKPLYDKIIAIEIESPNEVLTHPEQVARNLRKYSLLDERTRSIIEEVHVWTFEEAFGKLNEIYQQFLNDASIPQDYKAKVKIFSISIKKEKEEKKGNERPRQEQPAPAKEQPAIEIQQAIPTAQQQTTQKPAVTTLTIDGITIKGNEVIGKDGTKYKLEDFSLFYGMLDIIADAKSAEIETIDDEIQLVIITEKNGNKERIPFRLTLL